jgi:3-phenylpropionate/cinnamic acid dioxygenase small subunit
MPLDDRAIERFLFHEARLIDAHRYDDWHALWDEDATYWVPANDDDSDPARNVSVIYDRRGQLRNRIQRLRETLWLKEAAPRLKRLISNIEAEEDGGLVNVTANFILAELHHHRQIIWAGSTIHKLIPHGDTFRIRFKKVILLNNNEPLPNMLFLI